MSVVLQSNASCFPVPCGGRIDRSHRTFYKPKIRRENVELLRLIKNESARYFDQSFQELTTKLANCKIIEHASLGDKRKHLASEEEMHASKKICKEDAEDLLSAMFQGDELDFDFSVPVTSVLDQAFANLHNFVNNSSNESNSLFLSTVTIMEHEKFLGKVHST